MTRARTLEGTKSERRVVNAAMRLFKHWDGQPILGNGTLAKLLRACKALQKVKLK